MTLQLAHQQLLSLLIRLYDEREAGNITDLVMEHITAKKRIDRLLDKTLPLTGTQLDQLETISQQLLRHKPVQYVLGEAWFAGNKFYVNEHTLIPRPETEELVEWVRREAGSKESGVRSILDIGTGSGCIPITLKRKLPGVTITSIDISAEALKVAERNAAIQDIPVQLLQVDFLNEAHWQHLPKVDVIVSNPPYIKQSEEATMSRHVLDFEPATALFVPDEDALLFYRKIAAFGKTNLAQNGMIFMEINEAMGKQVVALFEKEGYQTTLKQDLQNKDRMLKAISAHYYQRPSQG
ncbi:MAG: peptide chain release factor N(5)-glutamine methyltransferase [Sediminibacterium sp.]